MRIIGAIGLVWLLGLGDLSLTVPFLSTFGSSGEVNGFARRIYEGPGPTGLVYLKLIALVIYTTLTGVVYMKDRKAGKRLVVIGVVLSLALAAWWCYLGLVMLGILP